MLSRKQSDDKRKHFHFLSRKQKSVRGRIFIFYRCVFSTTTSTSCDAFFSHFNCICEMARSWKKHILVANFSNFISAWTENEVHLFIIKKPWKFSKTIGKEFCKWSTFLSDRVSLVLRNRKEGNWLRQDLSGSKVKRLSSHSSPSSFLLLNAPNFRRVVLLDLCCNEITLFNNAIR